MKVVFIFIDGLGIGENNLQKNPCSHSKIQLFKFFRHESFPKMVTFDGIVKPIDAQLGVAGIPQSATGQAALLTGLNTAQLLNNHLSGYPNQKLRNILERHSIHIQLINMKKRPAFINVYRPIFFEKGPEALIHFLSVTSIANWKAGLQFFSFDHLRLRQAIYHDFTNRELIKRGYNVPLFTAEMAGRILARSSQNYDFTLYEYFMTDWAGHAQDTNHAVEMLHELERFILAFLNHIVLSETLVILTSDHGNIEDLTLKTHTSNPVPLIVWGDRNADFINLVESIVDVTPAIIRFIKP